MVLSNHHNYVFDRARGGAHWTALKRNWSHSWDRKDVKVYALPKLSVTVRVQIVHHKRSSSGGHGEGGPVRVHGGVEGSRSRSRGHVNVPCGGRVAVGSNARGVEGDPVQIAGPTGLGP